MDVIGDVPSAGRVDQQVDQPLGYELRKQELSRCVGEKIYDRFTPKDVGEPHISMVRIASGVRT